MSNQEKMMEKTKWSDPKSWLMGILAALLVALVVAGATCIVSSQTTSNVAAPLVNYESNPSYTEAIVEVLEGSKMLLVGEAVSKATKASNPERTTSAEIIATHMLTGKEYHETNSAEEKPTVKTQMILEQAGQYKIRVQASKTYAEYSSTSLDAYEVQSWWRH